MSSQPPNVSLSQPFQIQTEIPGLTYRDFSASVSPLPSMMPSSQEPRLQDAMKKLMAEELKGGIFQVDLTVSGAVLHADDKIVRTVVSRLQDNHKLTAKSLTSGGQSSSSEPRFPRGGFKQEPDSYFPLSHLFNTIINAANECMPGSYLGKLRFHRFGIEVEEIYGTCQRPEARPRRGFWRFANRKEGILARYRSQRRIQELRQGDSQASRDIRSLFPLKQLEALLLPRDGLQL